jgi:hypothetical protein
VIELLVIIDEHFAQNAANPIAIYDAAGATTPLDSLRILADLLAARTTCQQSPTERRLARTTGELMTLLLNVAAGKIAQTEIISPDGATVSQAITYTSSILAEAIACTEAQEAADENNEDEESCFCAHMKIEKILRKINHGKTVRSGLIPLDTAMIAYRMPGQPLRQDAPAVTRFVGVTPSPFRSQSAVRFDIGETGPVTVRVYDVRGRLVRELVNGVRAAGSYTVVWDGASDAGAPAPGGVYFVRFQAADASAVKQAVRIH